MTTSNTLKVYFKYTLVILQLHFRSILSKKTHGTFLGAFLLMDLFMDGVLFSEGCRVTVRT